MADNLKMFALPVPNEGNVKTFDHISLLLHSNFRGKCSFSQPVVLIRTMMVRLLKFSLQMH